MFRFSSNCSSWPATIPRVANLSPQHKNYPILRGHPRTLGSPAKFLHLTSCYSDRKAGSSLLTSPLYFLLGSAERPHSCRAQNFEYSLLILLDLVHQCAR